MESYYLRGGVPVLSDEESSGNESLSWALITNAFDKLDCTVYSMGILPKFILKCVRARTHPCYGVWLEIRKQLVGGSLFSPSTIWVLGSDSGCQAQQQTPLTTRPSQQPLSQLKVFFFY